MHPKVVMLIYVLPLVTVLLFFENVKSSQCFTLDQGSVRLRHWSSSSSSSTSSTSSRSVSLRSTASNLDCDLTESNFISRRQLFFLVAFTASTSPALAATSNNRPVKISQTQIAPNNVNIRIPRIGYSLYKTDPDQVQRGINIALQAGIRHFDVASMYNTNDIVGDTLFQYCNDGLPKLDPKGFVLSSSSTGSRTSSSSTMFRNRRKELFITHKIANEEQSTDIHTVKNHIRNQMFNNLKLSYIDMVMIHSPLTDSERRINTYKALIELKNENVINAIGVCHYSTSALDEIINVGLPPPDVIQLQLSPFNQHRDILSWAQKYNSLVSCSAWSRLSSVDGPQDGWAIVSKIAQSKQMTKAQVLIQWSLQNNFCCVPRSGVATKLERNAIYENSYKGMTDDNKWKRYYLTEEEMNTLNGLDEGLKVGKLGVVDGWKTNDIVDSNWDPTTIVFASINQQQYVSSS